MMRLNLSRIALGAVATFGILAGGAGLYQSEVGLSLRAQTGQTSGTFLHALSLYESNRIAEALTTIKPLVAIGHEPALNLVCGFVNVYEPVAATESECVSVLKNRPQQRLVSLTDIAIWAQEWAVASDLIAKRLEEGDQTSYFDRARLVFAAPKGVFDVADLAGAIEKSSAAEDPRGQYAAVLSGLNAGVDGTLSPVLAEILGRKPKFAASDAYFELAKLIQTGAVSSDLSYVEVLQRADATDSPHAARHLAQYFLANPDLDSDGTRLQGWLTKAASFNDPVAQYNLAVTILSSQNADKPMDQAISLLDKSATAGFVPALNMLGATLWQNPTLLADETERVREMALRLLEAASAKDDLNALFNLGNIYLAQQDVAKAVEYLTKGASLGSEPARALLKQIGATTE
jgi:TPR repeat protein